MFTMIIEISITNLLVFSRDYLLCPQHCLFSYKTALTERNDTILFKQNNSILNLNKNENWIKSMELYQKAQKRLSQLFPHQIQQALNNIKSENISSFQMNDNKQASKKNNKQSIIFVVRYPFIRCFYKMHSNATHKLNSH